jgi:hypothetical protein
MGLVLAWAGCAALAACGSSGSTLYALVPASSSSSSSSSGLAAQLTAVNFSAADYNATTSVPQTGLASALDLVSLLQTGTLTTALSTADDFVFVPVRHRAAARAMTSEAFLYQTDNDTVSGTALYDPDNPGTTDTLDNFTVVGAGTNLTGQYYSHPITQDHVTTWYSLIGTDSDPLRGGTGVVKWLETTDNNDLVVSTRDQYELRSPAGVLLYASDQTTVTTDDFDTGNRSVTYNGHEIYYQTNGYWVQGTWSLSDPDYWDYPGLRVGTASYVASNGVHDNLTFDSSGNLTGTVTDGSGTLVANLAMDANLNIYLVDLNGNPVQTASGQTAYLTVSFLTPLAPPTERGSQRFKSRLPASEPRGRLRRPPGATG